MVIVLIAIKKALSIAIRVIAMLLVAFSLWVPLVYTLLFVIIAGITGASLADNSNLFWTGLIISFVVSLGISFFMYERRRAKKRAGRAKRRGNVDGGERVVARDEGIKLNGNFQLHTCPYYNMSMNNAGNNMGNVNMGGHACASEKPQNYYQHQDLDHESWAAPSYKVYNPDRDESIIKEREQPKIFALRSDPCVFICEYSDRLDYYKHTRGGMVFMETKRK